MRLITNYITVVLLVLMFLNYVVQISFIENMVGIMTFFVIFLVVISTNKTNQIFVITMMGISAWILYYNKEPVDYWLQAITNNLPLVSLIVISPILSIPVKLGKYDYYINSFILRYTNKKGQLYFVISSLFFLLSPLLNLGAIHLVHSIINKLKLPKEFLGRVYIRSFFTASSWAPYFASVFLVIYYLKIPFKNYLWFGLILGIIQVVTSYLLYMWWEAKCINIKLSENDEYIRKDKIIEFIVALILLVCSIFLFEDLLATNIVVLISSIIILFTLVWSIYLKKVESLIHHMKHFFHNVIPRSSNEIVLFLSAGFFALAISNTNFGTFSNTLWQKIADISMILLIFSTIASIALISLAGIHHIVTISIILTSVDHVASGISDLVMAMIMLSSYAIGAMVSPVSPANTIVANLIKENMYEVIKYNLIYAALICLIHSIIIYTFCLFLG